MSLGERMAAWKRRQPRWLLWLLAGLVLLAYVPLLMLTAGRSFWGAVGGMVALGVVVVVLRLLGPRLNPEKWGRGRGG
jgi:hypothetical protein